MGGDFSPDTFYTAISITDLAKCVKVDDEKNTVTIDKYGVDVSQYEYGFQSDEASFKSFTRNANNFGNKAGILMIREKGNPASAMELRFVTMNPPADLKVVSQNDREVNLAWSYSAALMPEIKEFIVCRLKISSQPIQGQPEKAIHPNIIEHERALEIGRTPGMSFVDGNINPNEKYQYYIQAVDKNGEQSFPSSSVEVFIKDVTPPSFPGELRAGDVLRQGDNVQYAFPEDSGIRNVLLGPEREIALRWEPSSDNVGVVGYDIYRFATGRDFQTNTYWCEKGHLVGSTTETFFVDKELKFGAVYIYYVEAKDAAGNGTRNWVSAGTKKSTLANLEIANGSQLLTLDPAFAYYQSEYTLDVDNEVKSITLNPDKTDLRAKVKVNGVEAPEDDSIGPLGLDPGENTFVIEVVPRQDEEWSIGPESMHYTLTVNRANLANLPVLTLPESGTVLNEGDTYKAAGRLDIPDNLIWTGTVDYGDGTGVKPLQLNSDASFSLENNYLDNGRYKINVNFRYKDLGLVTGTLEVAIQNVAPTLTGHGIKDEITIQEGSPLTIEGSIVDPGQDSWIVAGYYGSVLDPTPGVVNEDKTFILQETFYDQKPEYDMKLIALDDDDGLFSRSIKIKVENVAPSVEAGGAALVQRGIAFTRAGAFTDPGWDKWQATVDFGDGSGRQPLSFRDDKTFDLKHVYLKTGSFTVTVRGYNRGTVLLLTYLHR